MTTLWNPRKPLNQQQVHDALQSTMRYLLDITGCKSVGEVIVLIDAAFGAENPEDAALYAVLDLFHAVGHLEPAGA